MSNIGIAENIGGVWLEVTAFPAGYANDGGITGCVINDKLNIRIKKGPHNIQEVGIFADGTDQSARLQDVVNNPKCKILEFHIDGGGDIVINSIVTLPAGFVFKFSAGVRLTGTGRIIYGLIDADENQHIFTGSIQMWIEGSVTSRTSVKWWGAKGDGILTNGVITTGTDDTVAIQKAINQAIYFNYRSCGCVFIPAGFYKITDTIHIGYGFQEENLYRSIILSGNRSGINNAGDSSICTTFLDRPAINIQGGRNHIIEDINIIGSLLSNPSPFETDFSSPTAFHTNVPFGWDKRYAPYAAITTDAYGGVKPVDTGLSAPYPDVIFQADVIALIAQNYQYGKRFSSFCQFRNISISGFVAGVVINPSPQGTQNDYMTFHKCYFTSVIYGFSAGAPNCRDLNLHDCVFIMLHNAIITTKHGACQGGIGIIDGCQFSYLYKIINHSTAYSGAAFFTGCTGEGIGVIGVTGTNFEGCKGVTFESCQFGFTHNYQSPRTDTQRPSYYEKILVGRYTKFVNCQLADYSVLTMEGDVDFEGCTLWPRMLPSMVGSTTTVPTWYINFLRFCTGGIIVYNGRKSGRRNAVLKINVWGLTTISTNEIQAVYDDVKYYIGDQNSYRYISDITEKISLSSSGIFQNGITNQPIRTSFPGVVEINLQSFAITGRTVTFTLANGQSSAMISIGDIASLIDNSGKIYILVISVISGLNITMVLMNNFYRNLESDFTGYTGTSPDFSNYATNNPANIIYIQSSMRWFVAGGIFGDIIKDSTTILNIRDGSGNPAANKLRIGDTLSGGWSAGVVGFDHELNNQMNIFYQPAKVLTIPTSTSITISNAPPVSGRSIQLFNVL